jgi:glycosyltransferase involved in cell wall biosynthesis
VKIYAVIPTHNRHADLAELLGTIPADVDVLVIDNASTPPIEKPVTHPSQVPNYFVHRDDEQPPNLSRLWNIGLNWAARIQAAENYVPAPSDYAVAILNDDVLLPPRLLYRLAADLIYYDVDIAFPCSLDKSREVNKDNPFPGVGRRLTGWCFMVRGSSGLRADESLRWWCGDDDLQAQAVRDGRGTTASPLTATQAKGLLHKHPDESTTGVLREQTEKDMATFVAKWGQRPW